MTPPAEPPDDEELWRRSCAGEEAAFTELYRRRGGALLRFAWRLTGSHALAEDVLQDVFLALVDAAARRPGAPGGRGFDPALGSLRAYLFGMARHAAGKRLRAVAAPAAAPAPEAVGQRHDEDEQALRVALGQLPPPFREVVLLCDLEGLSYDEAARALVVPIGTVRSRLFRGRRELAALLSTEAAPAAAPARLGRELR